MTSVSLPPELRAQFPDPLAEFTVTLDGQVGEGCLSAREVVLAVPPGWSWANAAVASVAGVRVAGGVLQAPSVNLPAVMIALVGLGPGGAEHPWALSLKWRSGVTTTAGANAQHSAADAYRGLTAAIAPLGPLSEVGLPAGLVPDGATIESLPTTVLAPGSGIAPDTRVPETMAQPFVIDEPSPGVHLLASVAFSPPAERGRRLVAQPAPATPKSSWRSRWSARRARRDGYR